MLCKEESVNVEQANMPSIESCDLSDHDRSNGATKTYKNGINYCSCLGLNQGP